LPVSFPVQIIYRILSYRDSCVGCRGTEMATSRFFYVKLDDIADVCWPAVIKTDRTSKHMLYNESPTHRRKWSSGY